MKGESDMLARHAGMLGLILLMAGCGGGDGVSLHATPLWTQVSNRTTCEAEVPASCPGYYGFVIDNQGNYTAGPNPQGQTGKGALTAAEWNQLQTAANAVANDIAAAPDALCKPQQSVPGESNVVLIAAAGQVYSVQDGMNDLCAWHGAPADSTALIDLIDTLRAKYYSF